MSRRRVVIPEWIERLQPGDVLQNAAGTFRVVREVGRYGPRPWWARCSPYRDDREGKVSAVYFTILHCSWTRRCYTLYFPRELGFRPVGVRVKLTRALDRAIARSLHDETKAHSLTCCDVRGIA